MSELQNQQNAPYAVAALVLGISSLLLGCLFVGLVTGIVGLVLANKGIVAYNANPGQYTGFGMLKAGRVCSIIGIIFGALSLLYYLIFVLILGAAGLAWLDFLG